MNIGIRAKWTFNLLLLLGFILIVIGMGQWIIPFIIATILAYCFHYPAKMLTEKLKISSSVSAGIILVFLVSLFTICGLFLIPLIHDAILILLNKLSILINSSSSDSINSFFHGLLQKLGINKTIDVGSSLQSYINESVSNIPRYLINFLQTGKSAVYGIIFAVMVPIITFYILKDWDKFAKYSLKLLNKMTNQRVVKILIDINGKLAEYIRGQLKICLILAILYIIGLKIIGVTESLVCGLFSGLISIAPFFGPCIGLGTTLAMCLNDFNVNQYIATIGLYILIPFIDSNYITPKLIGAKLGIPPVWMLFSICATTSILGTTGIFLSVPLTVIFTTICRALVKEN